MPFIILIMIAPLLTSHLSRSIPPITHTTLSKQLATSIRFSCSQYLAADIANYQQYLDKHNKSIKNPHPRLQTEEEKIVTKYVEARNYGPIIDFMAYNTNKILCHDKTSQKIDESVLQDWHLITDNDKATAAFALVSHGETKAF